MTHHFMDSIQSAFTINIYIYGTHFVIYHHMYSIINLYIIIHVHYYNDSRIRLTDNRIRLLHLVSELGFSSFDLSSDSAPPTLSSDSSHHFFSSFYFRYFLVPHALQLPTILPPTSFPLYSIDAALPPTFLTPSPHALSACCQSAPLSRIRLPPPPATPILLCAFPPPS